jgi:hypothetical protein
MLQDIPNGFECVCKKCGAKFASYYYTNGLIEHMNETNNKILIDRLNRLALCQ